MIVEVYRKYPVANGYAEGEMYISFIGVKNIQLTANYIYGDVMGEQLTIARDDRNYNYYIKSQEGD